MKTPLTTLTEMTTIGWSMLLGNQPTTPVLTPAGKAPKVAKAAPAKKRKPARTAKGKKRK